MPFSVWGFEMVLLMQEKALPFTSTDDIENHQKRSFKDFTLQQHYRFNRFSQSAGSEWSVMCVCLCAFVSLLFLMLTTQPMSSWLAVQYETERNNHQQSSAFWQQRKQQQQPQRLYRIPPLFLTLLMCANMNSWWIHSLPSWPQQGAHVT